MLLFKKTKMFLRNHMIALCVIAFFVIFALWLALYVKREVGRQPTEPQLQKFEKLPYFNDGRFFNYYKPIDGFKNLNELEEVKNQSMFIIMKNLLFPKKVQMKKVNLTKNSFAKKPDDFAFYWFGHSTVLLELSGKRIIIDPVFGNASMIPFTVRRRISSPVKRKDLPKIDYVLITHNHYDHLERKTIQYLNKHNSIFIVPLGLYETLIGWGVEDKRIVELGWEDFYKIDDKLKIIAEPAMHFSGRWLNDRNKTLWNSYVIQNDGRNIFCAGDGAYGEQIDMIAKKYKKFELAMIESDAWNVRWPYVHMFTRESIEIVKKLNANYLLPVHWGVFNLAMHDFDTSIKMLQNEAKNSGIDNKLLLPAIGEKVVLIKDEKKAIYNIKSV